MMKVLEWFKYLLLLIITFVVYYFLQSILLLPFMNIITNLSSFLKSIILLFSELIVFIILILINIKLIIKDFKDFKKNFKKYLLKGFLCWLIGFIGMGVMNILISFTVGAGVAENEALNREIITKMPLYAIPVIAFTGPIIEETVFRLSFRKVIPNKALFIIITSLIFASIHMTASFNSFSEIFLNIPELLHFFPYLSLALAFGFAYRETDNIFTTICLHIFHNTYCLVIIIMGMFL